MWCALSVWVFINDLLIFAIMPQSVLPNWYERERASPPFVDTCKLLCSRKVTCEHTGVFVWGGLWLILIEITFKQWVVEGPELGIKFKNVWCFRVRAGWLPAPKVQQKLLRWRVGEQWEWSPPRIREFIFCRELKNRNKTVYLLFMITVYLQL